MEFLKYLVIALIIFCAVTILILAARQRKVIKFIIANAFFGVVTFLILYFLKEIIGVKLALNWYTVSSSMVFGVPAVIGFLILNLII